MTSNNRILNFTLDADTIKKLMKEKSIKLDVKKNESTELVLPDTRIRLDVDKKAPVSTATYYNNKSSNLFFFGNTVSANATVRKVLSDVDKKRTKTNNKSDAKEREKTARGIESLDIPSIPNAITTSSVMSSPPPPTKPLPQQQSTKSSSLKKTSTGTGTPPINNNSNNNNTTKNSSKKLKSTTILTTPTSNNNIPSSRGSVTPQNNTPRPSSNNSLLTPPVEKLHDRVLQLLALRPYQITTLAKMLDCTQWDVKKIVDDVGLLLPDPSQKKKYCLKPSSYKNIRIWDWPLYNSDEKNIACANAKEAYDILQIPSDAIERFNLIDPSTTAHKLIQPPPGRVPIISERDRAIAAKKSSNKSLKRETESNGNGNSRKRLPDKKASPDKGKGKTTPSGFSYATTPSSEPAAPTPSSKLTSPITTSANKIKSSSSQLQQRQQQQPPSSSQQQHQTHLKPSSSNKKVGSKALPQQQPLEKLSPPTKRKIEPVETPSSSTYSNHHHTPTSSKRIKSEPNNHHHHESSIVELSVIRSQPMFDKYCAKFLLGQKEYQNTKTNFKAKFPQYIKVLENTKPPTGSKRSYFDLKLEYHDMVKENYLKTEDETSWEEAESHLRECNEKRRRLNFMWSSIEKNMSDHNYKLNHKM